MNKFINNFKKLFIKLQLFFLRTKLMFRVKKLNSVIMGVVVVVSILVIMGGKFVVSQQAAQATNEGSNLAQLMNSDLQGCYDYTSKLASLKATYPNNDTIQSAAYVTPAVIEDGSWFKGTLGNTVFAPIPNAVFDCYVHDKTGTVVGTIASSGTLSTLNNYTAYMYSNPSTTTTYDIGQTIASINPVEQVQAQSTITQTGIDTLQVIRSIWESVRNITFLFYIAIFLIISFAIMFRQKIGGQTYVNIINSIPSIIISLVLVVFSYSISGLIISIGNWSMGLIYNIVYTQIDFYYDNGVPVKLNTIQTTSTDTLANSKNGNGEIIDRKFQFWSGSTPIATTLMPFNNDFLAVFNVFGNAGIRDSLDSATQGINVQPASYSQNLQSAIFNILGGIGKIFFGNTQNLNGLIFLVLIIAAFFSSVKLFFSLLKEYIMMLVMPIVSPIYFAASALPGKNKFIQKWLKSMFGSVFTFVAVYTAFVLMIIIGRGIVLSIPPQITGSTQSIAAPMFLSLSTNMTPEILTAFISYGIFIMTPQLPKIVKDAVGAASDFDKYTGAIGNETKAAARRIPGLNMIPGI